MTPNTTKKKIVGNPTKTQLGLKGFFAVLTFFLAAFALLPGEPLENGTVAVERHDCFREISPTDIKADGWLREFLVRQQEGLTGHYWVQGYRVATVGRDEAAGVRQCRRLESNKFAVNASSTVICAGTVTGANSCCLRQARIRRPPSLISRGLSSTDASQHLWQNDTGWEIHHLMTSCGPIAE